MLEKCVSKDFLKRGMYVSRLDRPWGESDFLFQGFYIKTQDDIEQIKRQCEFIYIDIERGEGADRYIEEAPQKKLSKIDKIKETLKVARSNYNKLSEEFSRAMDDIRSGGDLRIVFIQVSLQVEFFSIKSIGIIFMCPDNRYRVPVSIFNFCQ